MRIRQTLDSLLIFTIIIVACSQPSVSETSAPYLPVAQTATSGTSATQAQTPPVSPTVSGHAGDLQGLDFDTFLDDSFKMLLLRQPEWVTEAGLADILGVRNDRLNDLSLEYMQETYQLEREILDLLRQYDYQQLSAEQNISALVYDWYLQDRVEAQQFADHEYLVSLSIFGLQNTLVQLFTDLHPLRNQQDAEDYITRLSQVETKFSQIIAALERQQAAGVVLPRFLMPSVLSDITAITQAEARSTPFYTTFASKVTELEGVDAQEGQDLLDQVEKQIHASVVPAYQGLEKFMQQQEEIATYDCGVWKFPDGEDYYAYTIRHHTTSDLAADEVHQIGLQEVERLQVEMLDAFRELGYEEDLSFSELFQRLVSDSGTLYGDQIMQEYQRIINQADAGVQTAFNLKPSSEAVVVGVPEGGYYIPPAADGSRPGTFYATQNGSQPKYEMRTIAYHETTPGHHYQLAIAQEMDLPLFRNLILNNFFAEGWALYAEQLVDEMGFYQDDPVSTLGRLQWEAFRAARLVVDTGIHAKRWTYDQAVDYMVKNTGQAPGFVNYEVARYIVWPGQALSYKIGMLEILEQRQKIQDALGDQFDLGEFHDLLLGSGALPQVVLEQVVDEYIESR